jgi:hypothetical protein
MQQPVATCTGKSIGFLPLSIREATSEEKQRRPELAGVPIIDKAAGLEYAVAPVPCNPEAQMEAVAKGREIGLIDEPLAELLMEMSQIERKLVTPPEVQKVKEQEVAEEPGVPFVRAATLRTALERQLACLRPEVAQQVQRQIREVFCAATGRVC